RRRPGPRRGARLGAEDAEHHVRLGRGAARLGLLGGRRGVSRQSTAAAEAAFREERAAVLATLIRQVGDFQLAEDAVQDAFAAAIVAWERDGVPQRPGAWITTTARRKAIDRLRRDRVLADRVE